MAKGQQNKGASAGNARQPLPPAAPPEATAISEGQRLLRARAESYGELAALLDTNKGTVHRWATGAKSPGPTARAKLEAVLAIPAAAWGRAASAEPSVPTKAAKASPVAQAAAISKSAARASTDAEFDRLLKSMKAIELDGLMATDAARILKLHWDMLEQAEKRRRAAEERLVDSPEWHRYIRALVATLRPFPDAMKAVRDNLRELWAEAG